MSAIYLPTTTGSEPDAPDPKLTQLAEMLVLVSEGVLSPAGACAELGVDEDEFAARCEDPLLPQAVERARASMTRAGALSRAKALSHLPGVLDRINQAVAGPDVAVGTLLQAAQTLAKIAGLDQPKPVVMAEQPRFTVRIILGGKPQELGNGSAAVFVKGSDDVEDATVLGEEDRSDE